LIVDSQEQPTMSNPPPPVPPAARSPKGPGGATDAPKDMGAKPGVPRNLAEQDRQGNIKQNTTHQGYQQDR
jgi:hypothetical protein